METYVNNDNCQSSNSIKAIDKRTVHQICSGQVVLDLSTAVKELVENSIDAGANNIEIRLKEYGKEVIEVSDNGQGIKEEDFEALALKHYTSKLREFNDLPSVNTFGFRGEALSSLSALADLSITTHHESMQVGSKLSFDHDGKLVDRRNTAREYGTTVSISSLFYTLPVRHKEFHRNYKKDFSKLMNILYAFCLVNGTVRINCINQVGSKKNKLISTNGKNCVLDTITTIFGANQVKTLIQIEQSDPLDTVLDEYNISKDTFSTYADMFLINGYISMVTHGSGRSVSDRQFFFINNRPCDFPKLARVVNEVYHMYNNHQYPFVYLNMVLNKDYVDVNVTPDKRQIMIQQENILLVIVKSTLKKMFEQNATFFAENKQTNMTTPVQMSLTSSPIIATKTPTGSIESQQSQSSPLDKCPSQYKNSAVLNEIHSNLSQLGIFKNKNDNSFLDTSLSSPLDRFRSKYEKSPSSTNSSFAKKQRTPDQSNLLSFFSTEPKKRKFDEDLIENMPKKTLLECIDIELNDSLKSETRIFSAKDDDNEGIVDESNTQISMNHESFNENNDASNTTKFQNKSSLVEDVSTDAELLCEKTNDTDTDICIVDEVAENINLRPSVEAHFNFQRIKQSYAVYIDNKFDKDKKKTAGAFHAKISASDNHNAEEELGKNITKDMFHRMKIVGQFNLGFIITKLADDLFIVDQHATDEKYNYETLQLKKCLKGQRLIQPITMNLTLVNESVLIDNLQIFQKNGFEFDIKEEDLREQSKLTDEKSNDDLNLSDGMQLADILDPSVDIRELPATIGGGVSKKSDVILDHSGDLRQPHVIQETIDQMLNEVVKFNPDLQEQINSDLKKPADEVVNLYVDKEELDDVQKLPADIQKKPDVIGEHLISIIEKPDPDVGEGPGDISEIASDASLVEQNGTLREYESRIKLLTVPTSRNWTFSVDDVEELIYLLTESPGVMCRPSRVHKMFASRACRKSIMIGTALNKQQMKRLVSHMAEIDHPWNCPHGRPTMRHLINLSRIDC